jgi:anti-sigma regulatory factor (Ser/Thr protein kinase)
MEEIANNAQFPADLQFLHSMIQWVREQAEKCCFSKKELLHIELAIEETIVNIIQHGYQKKEGKIHLKTFCNGDFLIEIQDEAPPFNPLKDKPSKDLSKIGGMGIDLVCRCMDEVFYERKGVCNLLILKKKRKK